MAAGDEASSFWANVDIAEDCWLWRAATSKQGYGIVRTANGMARAHRRAWELTNGEIPAGVRVLHKCDVRNCVRPCHLFLGTDADNVRDCVEKGRNAAGVRHGCAKLSEDEARAIKSSDSSGLALAAQFNISTTNVSAIRRGRIWQHIT